MSKDKENINEEIQEEVNGTPETESEVEETPEGTQAPEEKAETAEKEKDPLEEAQAKIAELNDALLRKMAEFENYRKRTVKEKAELIMEQAAAQRKELIEASYQQARQLRVNANNYANQVFDHLILNVGNALAVLNQAREELLRNFTELPFVSGLTVQY